MDRSLWESFRQFRRVVWKYWEASVLGLGAIFLSVLIAYLAGWDAIPTRVAFVLSTIALLHAAFVAFHHVRLERDDAEAARDNLLSGRPRLMCVGQKWIPIYVNNVYRFHALQVWVGNRPDIHTVGTTARDVSVRLFIYRAGESVVLYELGSQWALAIDPNAAGYTGFQPGIDIPPNDNPAKFFLVLQHRGDADCYIHSFGVLHSRQDGKHPRYRLVPGEYRVMVRLSGENVSQELELRFKNHGVSPEPEIAGYPKQHEREAEPPTLSDVVSV